MRTFHDFIVIAEAAYDASFMSGAQVRRTGEGGRISSERRKSAAEKRRTKRVGGGQTAPSEYKPRKDIGQQRQRSEREQQPEQERGSARERQLAAAKEERRKAAQARAAAKKGGGEAPAAKPRAKDVEKQASQLLRKTGAKPKPKAAASDERFASSRNPEEHMIKGKYTKAEKKQLVRAGKQKLRDLVLKATGKKKESELKHRYTGPDT